MAPQQTILLTGGTGNIGNVTLEHFLDTPHKVKIVLRRRTVIPYFESKYTNAVSSNQLSFIVIPDMTLPTAFDAAAASVTTIMHIATPLASSDKDSADFAPSLIDPTWAIDKNILEAAKKNPSVKRVIVCGTILQTFRSDISLFDPSFVISSQTYNNLTREESLLNWSNAYQYGKTAAERKLWEWIAAANSHSHNAGLGFDVVMLLPSLVTGRVVQPDFSPKNNAPGGINCVYTALLAQKSEDQTRVEQTKAAAAAMDMAYPFFVDTDDVARCHVRALDRARVPGNARYIVCAKEILDFRIIARRLRDEYVELRARILDVEEEAVPEERRRHGGMFAKLDAGRADEVFGTEWKSAYESVRATVLDILEWEANQS